MRSPRSRNGRKPPHCHSARRRRKFCIPPWKRKWNGNQWSEGQWAGGSCGLGLHQRLGFRRRRAQGRTFAWPSPTATASTSAAASAPSSASTATDDDGVEVTGERTREQRDAEGRKRAIDLNLLDANKRPRTASTELQTQVAKARSVCTGEVQKRVEELIRPAVADFVVDKIDEVELVRRKAVARAKAESEHAPYNVCPQDR